MGASAKVDTRLDVLCNCCLEEWSEAGPGLGSW